mgnify:CR=1 FL=1
MKNTKYNGWANYATWRINLEVIDGLNLNDDFNGESDAVKLADMLKEYAEAVVLGTSNPDTECSLMQSYAYAFMSDVNWYEIATNLIDAYAKEA